LSAEAEAVLVARDPATGRSRPLTGATAMKVGALGDVHGDFASVRAIMARHPDVEWWVTVGDLADGRGAYEAPPVLLHWIKGNNDNSR
jgi:predicted phosphodiesterase